MFKDSVLTQFLKDKQLSATMPRLEILSLFYNSSSWISLNTIVKSVDPSFSRSTIYRTLLTMTKKNILLKFVDIQRMPYYFFYPNSEKDSKIIPVLPVAKFKCIKCGAINDISLLHQHIEVPEGYAMMNFNLFMNGLCETCQLKKVNK